ncbi:MAG: YdcF family protein [Bacteroidetes bacterium]|nr:YdcF family protein [Bacteroidota bacterium]
MIGSALIVQLASCLTPRKGPQKLYNNVVTSKQSFDAIIVPGIPFNNGGWDSVMKARVIWAWVLYKNGITRNVIFSGSAVYSPYKESVIMGLYAQQLGIPRERIFYDTVARHSTENVYFSYLVAKQNGFKSLALATDPFQSFMLKGFLSKRFGTPIQRLPFVVDTLKIYNYLNPSINPESAKVHNFESIVEKESYIKRFMGTLGKGIDWQQYKDGRVEAL